MAEAAAAGKRGPCCTLGSLAELRQVAMALAGGWAAAATAKGRAVVTVPMGGQHVLLAIRIDQYVRHRSRKLPSFERHSNPSSYYCTQQFLRATQQNGARAVSVTITQIPTLPSARFGCAT